MSLFAPPPIKKLVQTAVYSAQHEVLMQEERVHRLKIALRQAEATLKEMSDREEALVKKLDFIHSNQPEV
jgi:hypothetical protein